MIARFTSALTSSSLVTLALLLAMQALIRLQPGAQTAAAPGIPANWIRIPRPEPPPESREWAVDKDVLVASLPPPAGRPEAAGDALGLPPVTHPDSGPFATRPDRIGDPDGPLISIVRVQPVYPPVAEQRGLEGWVDVRFDVLPSGVATNIEVIASSHRLFEKAAVDAAARFRFKAPVVSGVPQTAQGIEYRFRFTIDD